MNNHLKSIVSLQELARRFNLSFGLDMSKQREALAALHRYFYRICIFVL